MSYIKIYNEILTATANLIQSAVLCKIVEQAEHYHTATPILQQSYISESLHIDKRTTRNALQTLTQGGYLTYAPTYYFKGENKYSSTKFQLTEKTLQLIGLKTTNPETKADSKPTPSVTTSANKAKPTKQQSEEERLAEQLAKAIDEGDNEALVRIGKTIKDTEAQQRIRAMVVTIRNKRANEVKQ